MLRILFCGLAYSVYASKPLNCLWTQTYVSCGALQSKIPIKIILKESAEQHLVHIQLGNYVREGKRILHTSKNLFSSFWLISPKWLTFQAKDMLIREWKNKVLGKSAIKKGGHFSRGRPFNKEETDLRYNDKFRQHSRLYLNEDKVLSIIWSNLKIRNLHRMQTKWLVPWYMWA